MGTCCSFERLNEDKLIKAQSVCRRHLACKSKADLKRQYITKIAVELSKPIANGVSVTSQLTQREIENEFELALGRIISMDFEDTFDAADPSQRMQYQGQWKFVDDKRKIKDGVGIMVWQDGSRYLGQFQEDKMEGKGRMTQANGSVYQGEWRNGMANGRGTFIDAEGSTYDGEWKDDLQHGFGCETWNQGKIKFEGNYVQGKKNGKGRYEWADGSFYEGEFFNSVFQGEGMYYFAESERTYTGQFMNNLFDGKGKLTFSDGRMYEGDFKGGKREGQGTMLFPNGNKYIGQWQNDVQHGIGVYYSHKEGIKKQGQYVNGKRTAWLSNPIKVGGQQ